jgi:hypothetical protein
MNPQTNRAIIAGTTPLRLTSKEMLNPKEVVMSFYSSFDLEDIRQLLWQMTSTTICLDDETLGLCIRRDQILAFYEETERAIEAMYLILHP